LPLEAMSPLATRCDWPQA